ncbi:FadR/GntR family transcriptional regulator [Sporosarcina trichiuri]|uniref:FadR/GntR family transcriptional regulator n=1 Tax=Sporosarcina trichiuri TaxID=3056445 RepID=UPI0025B51F91|nr:FadR/GntR family transcriptional regulator [Sporosarcina sp. 0.2-SM1T-5]WJY27074.1 FadR/GntR family transcriptional regulator [Sporosarcina sp. 0.2-SM1T-5]
MVRKTHRKSLVEQVAEQMEQLIEQQHWTVGMKLPPEMELMAEFGVSRNTLREAIRALVHAGLLETKQGSGTLVRSSSTLGSALARRAKKSTMLETLEVREALEKQAAQLAAARRTETDLTNLEACIQSCRHASAHGDVEQFITSDLQFHKNIVLASGNPLLVDLYEHMTGILYAFIQDVLAMEPALQKSQKVHLELLEAIRKQDPESAACYAARDMKMLKEMILDAREESYEETNRNIGR